MRVILKRRWFVGGNRYRSVGKSPVEIPDKYRDKLPKDAVVVPEPVKVPVEDAPEKETNPHRKVVEVPVEDAPEKKPYVNPAHDLDPERQFAEAFSEVNEEAKSEVDTAREQIKTSK